AGVLRAVSVGFHANKYEPLEGSKVGGLHFLEQELVECSLVSVPANANALAVAKALGISREGQRLIFGVPAENDQTPRPRGRIGVPAGSENLIRRHQPMNQLSEKIQGAQNDLVAMRDQLSGLIEADDLAKSTELTEKIEQVQNQIAVWERAERALGSTASDTVTVPASRTTVIPPGARLPANLPKAWAQPKKKDEEPGYLFIRHCAAVAVAHVTKRPLDQVLQERYGHYPDFEAVKDVNDWYVRAATAPATLTTVGWAAELAQTQYGEFFEALMPGGIYGPLAPRGFRATLGRYAQISMPTRQA